MMAARNCMKFYEFAVFLVIAAFGSFFFGCSVSALEKPLSNSNANNANDASQRLNFAALGATPNPANANAATNINSNASAEELLKQAAEEISQNLQNANVSVTNSNPNTPARKHANNPQFDFAAAQNQNLARSLVWTFGGKLQNGWYIYKPLICETIKADMDADENEFAEILAGWQKANGMAATGILDTPTMNSFVAKWQANRLKSKSYASPNELLLAPTVDFFDPSRPDELRQVERATYAAYKRLLAAAIADKSLNLKNTARDELASPEQFLKIVSAFRSRDYQDKLRKESPNSGRAGLATTFSAHFTGRALDIYVGGEPVTTKDENRAVQIKTPVYLWLVKNAGKFGFKPYFYEPWHWEYAPE